MVGDQKISTRFNLRGTETHAWSFIAHREGAIDLIFSLETLRIAAIPTKLVDTGQIAVFNCILSRGVATQFTWAKNGQLVSGDRRVRLVSDEESSMLKISNVQVGDRGNYTCIAKNAVSEARAVATLYVQGEFGLDLKGRAFELITGSIVRSDTGCPGGSLRQGTNGYYRSEPTVLDLQE